MQFQSSCLRCLLKWKFASNIKNISLHLVCTCVTAHLFEREKNPIVCIIFFFDVAIYQCFLCTFFQCNSDSNVHVHGFFVFVGNEIVKKVTRRQRWWRYGIGFVAFHMRYFAVVCETRTHDCIQNQSKTGVILTPPSKSIGFNVRQFGHFRWKECRKNCHCNWTWRFRTHKIMKESRGSRVKSKHSQNKSKDFWLLYFTCTFLIAVTHSRKHT